VSGRFAHPEPRIGQAFLSRTGPNWPESGGRKRAAHRPRLAIVTFVLVALQPLTLHTLASRLARVTSLGSRR
jgi:hypothetical protein